MTSNRFFVKKININHPFVTLEEDEHHHISRVVRKKIGDIVFLFDEYNQEYQAKIEDIEKNRTRLLIIEKITSKERAIKVILAQAVLRSKNMELIFQKGTELGVDGFIPVWTDRSIPRSEDNFSNKMERWRRICVSAAKQCGRIDIPVLETPVTLKKFLNARKEHKKILLTETGGLELRKIILSDINLSTEKKLKPETIIIFVGPEGGWTQQEEKDILSFDFVSVSLGKSILRAETAAISTVAIITHFWN